MNTIAPDAITSPRFIDANRLTLPIALLDHVGLVLPGCISEISDEGNYRDIHHVIALFAMVVNELRRLQEQAKVEGGCHA